jgi:Na+-transporting NADH:ubiquinone oxidoreductase subunit D
MGYTFVLIMMSLIRELLSNGSILNMQLLGENWINWTIFAIAPGGFFIISLFIWGLRVWLKYYEE